MQGLTARQEQTLDFIRKSIEERGYPPTLREIGEYMGIRSTNGVNDHLRALEKKGYLKHQQDGLRYLYSATTSPAVAKRTALHQYVQTFFGGSLKQMMTALVAEASWRDDELQALKAGIDRVRKERKPQP
jgi:SOS-response transcriptional repressor LexA